MPMLYTKRTRGLFNPNDRLPFRVSRSKIDLFIECPRCFYLDRRCGVPRTSGFPFTLNSAVDFLLKKEFDIHRAENTQHPLMKTYGIDAVPFAHKNMDMWRDNFTGVQYLHEPTNLLVTGAVDDVWINKKTEEIYVVDYKSTSKDSEVNLDAEWQDGYKRQMEVYQWLLRKSGFKVSETGYFVYANGQKDRKAFDGKLEFDITIIPYEGSDSWIEKTLHNLKENLLKENIPDSAENCEYCNYIDTVNKTVGLSDSKTASRPIKKVTKKSSGAKKTETISKQTLF